MKEFTNLHAKSTKILKTISVLFIFTLFSCAAVATGSSIITGTKRPAINPSEVKIYLDPPAQYENIGIIEVTSEVYYSRQEAQDKAMSELKSRAAIVGANGVLLTNTGSQSIPTIACCSNCTHYRRSSSDNIIAQGKVIYVTQE